MDNDEKYLDKRSLIIHRNPNYNSNVPFLKKEIIYDIDKGKYYLYEKENNKIKPTNFYASKIQNLNISHLGKMTYDERLKNNSIEKINHKIDDSLYHPRSKYFDGFSQIPRPLVQPFSNTKTLKAKKELINCLNKSKVISLKKVKTIFEKKRDENLKCLDYYTGTISDIVNHKSKNTLLSKINDAIGNDNLSQKEIESLNKLKNNLLLNSTHVINGKKIIKPKDIFQQRYNINHNIMFINPIKELSNNKDKDKSINLNTYNLLYKSINNNTITRIKDKYINNYKFKDEKKTKIIRPKSVTNIIKNDNLKIISTTNKHQSNSVFLPEKLELNNNESKRYDTEEDYFDIFSQSRNKNNNKINIKSQSMNEKINKKNIHFFIDLKKNSRNEKKHLVGYIKPLKKEMPYIRKGVPKYKSTGELYKKELDLFKIVNPDKMRFEEEENKRRLNFIKKKIENSRVFEFIKYKKSKDKKDKNSTLNSAKSFKGNQYIADFT